MSGLYLLWLITAWSNVENRISYPDDLVDQSMSGYYSYIMRYGIFEAPKDVTICTLQ